jgi:hypothetical protein
MSARKAPRKIRRSYRLDPSLVRWIERRARRLKTTQTSVVEEAISVRMLNLIMSRYG